MTLNEYQELTYKTAKYPIFSIIKEEELDVIYYPFLYPALGLAGETGEVLEIIKKIVREQRKFTYEDKDKLKFELGDVLWYLARLAEHSGLSLNEIAEANIAKLKERHKK